MPLARGVERLEHVLDVVAAGAGLEVLGELEDAAAVELHGALHGVDGLDGEPRLAPQVVGDDLDDDLKVIVEDCGRAEAMSYFTRLNAANATAIQAFKDYGVIVELLPASIDEAFLVVAAEYMDELGAEDPAMAEMLASHTAFWDTWKSLYGG